MNDRFMLPVKFLLALAALSTVTWLIYAPGLQGGFLFDDFANLPAIGVTGPIDNWPAFWRYITSGIADPLGRPLALVSFLLDAHDWPAEPFPFKRSNLILHLINGALLALMLRKLGQTLFSTNRSHWSAACGNVDLAAILAAGFWLIHPLLVSTTLYIVQREAMLSATLVLLGLLAWLRGREAMLNGRILSGFLWIMLGLVGCTLLAMLSKANGILLPAFAVVLDITITPQVRALPKYTNQNRYKRAYRFTMAWSAWLPAILVSGYLFYQAWHGMVHGIPSLRPWTLEQRLLTEPRVLMDYLKLLWLPRPFTPGLFNDQIHASTSLWSPFTTLPSIIALAALSIGAWLCRHTYPAWAATALFYFVGQSLESSSIPLELYFEHRNYLPAMLMFWPIALWLCDAIPKGDRIADAPNETVSKKTVSNGFVSEYLTSERRLGGIRTVFKPLLAITLLLGLGFMTHARASLWGDTRGQAQLWAALNPNSPRAQANIANEETNSGHPSLAVARLEPALAHAPDQAQLAMNLFNAQCRLGHVTPALLISFTKALRTTRDVGPLLVNWFSDKLDQIGKSGCTELSLTTLGILLDAAASNPNLNLVYGRRQDMDYLRGRMSLMQGNAEEALFNFNRALDEDAQASIALQQAALLGSEGYPRQGLAHLDHFEVIRKHVVNTSLGMARLHAWVLQHQHYWPKELAHLRDTLNKDAVQQTDAINESCKPSETFCGS